MISISDGNKDCIIPIPASRDVAVPYSLVLQAIVNNNALTVS